MVQLFTRFFLVVWLGSFCLPRPHAADYYVDFDTGSDSGAGTSAGAAWKHAPGDPNATGNAARALSPGDRVLIKGGVYYRGWISIPSAGSAAQPIVYKGDAWGVGKAIVDGSVSISGPWQRCVSAADCGGNANWQNIYTALVNDPAIANPAIAIGLFHNDRPLAAAQQPPSTTPLYQSNTNYYTVPPSTVSSTSLSDSRLAQLGGSELVGGYVFMWVNPNEISGRVIKSYNTSGNTITFDSAQVYTDRDTPYAVANVINDAVFDAPGEFYLSPTPEADGSYKLYVWPLDNEDLSTSGDVSLAFMTRGIDVKDHNVLEGFKIQKQVGEVYSQGRGGSGTTGVTIRNNEIQLIRMTNGAAIHCSGGNPASNLLIEDNYIHDSMDAARGIQANGDNIVFHGNWIVRSSRTGMYFAGVHNGMIVHNTVLDSKGTHGNAMSIYQGSSNVLVAGNYVSNSTEATYEYSDGVIFYNNFLGDGIKCWSSCTNTAIINNTMRGSVGIFTSPDYIMRNNIIHGGGIRSYNIYTDLVWNQDERYGWYLLEGETIEYDLDRVFNNAATADFTLFDTSIAMDAGTDVSSLLPVSQFPDYDFFKDVEGNPRLQGGAWDIGAYEGLGEPDLEDPSVPQNLQAAASSESAIVLNWTVSTDNVGVSGYNVFRDGAQIVNSPTPTYTDTGLQASTSYSYEVNAVDGVGNQSARSAAAAATTLAPDVTAPSAPTGLNAQAVSAFAISLSWNPSTDGRGVTGYHILRDGAQVGASDGPTYDDNGFHPPQVIAIRSRPTTPLTMSRPPRCRPPRPPWKPRRWGRGSWPPMPTTTAAARSARTPRAISIMARSTARRGTPKATSAAPCSSTAAVTTSTWARGTCPAEN